MIGLSTNQKTNKTRHDRKKTGLECGTKCDFVSELSVFKVFCVSNVSEFVSSHIKTTELRKNSNSTANAFVTVKWSLSFCAAFVLPARGDVNFVYGNLSKVT